MFLLVQSPERSPSYLTDRSLEFLKAFRRDLVDLPASQLRYITMSYKYIRQNQRSIISYNGRFDSSDMQTLPLRSHRREG